MAANSLNSALHCSLILNAGGESRRMGRPKALLPVPPHGEPLVQAILEKALILPLERVILVTNDPDIGAALTTSLPLQVLPDGYPGTGPLGGLATALPEVPGWALVLACDLPLLQRDTLTYLWHLVLAREGNPVATDAVVPRVGDRDQPLLAFYHRRCLPSIRSCLEQGRLRANSFFPSVHHHPVTEEEMRQVDPELLSFVNVNTPDDWEAVRRRWRED